MAKKTAPRQKQAQKQETKINIRIGDISKRSKRKRSKKPSQKKVPQLFSQLPPVVYQTPPQLIFYGGPDSMARVSDTPAIVSEQKKPKTILEDVGVGTEGLVEILDLPTKRETLSELIVPVSKKSIIEPEPRAPLKIRMEKPPEPRAPLKIRMEKPPEQPLKIPPQTPALFTPEMQSSITEPSAISGKTIFNERVAEPPMSAPFSMIEMREPVTKRSEKSKKVMQPPEMQVSLFEQTTRSEPALLQPPETPASLVSYARPASEAAIMAPLEPIKPGKLGGITSKKGTQQQKLEAFATFARPASEAVIMAPLEPIKPGKLGGITSKKGTLQQKLEAFATFAGIPKESMSTADLEQARKDYFAQKKRESRQRKKAEYLPEGFK